MQRESLYRFLQKCLNTKKREVAALSEYFRQNTFDFEYCAYGDRPDLGFTDRDRESYFQRIPERYLESAVVFLDPDNGLEVKSAGRSNLHKYMTYDEVGSLFRRMDNRSVLVIYQHLPRAHRKLFLYGTFGELQHQAQIKANSEWMAKMRAECSLHQLEEKEGDSACSGLGELR